MNKTFYIDGESLTTRDVFRICKSYNPKLRLELSKDALAKMNVSREFVLNVVESDEPIYSINTGFGALSNLRIEKENLTQLQYNLIRSHCTGVGEPFSHDIVRAIMLLRANCLSTGHSGVNPEIVQLLLDFINHDIIPVVPEKGSVGASGDLAPLSHVALALIGEGDVYYKGKEVVASFAMQDAGLKAPSLGPKDGLALINGTAVMLALGTLYLEESKHLMKLADVISAITNEAVRGTSVAYDIRISKVKPHRGQLECAHNLNLLLTDSEIRNSHTGCDRVQDPYSLRCIPQVHGACRQTIYHTQDVFDVEINSVTDNPLIFLEDNDIISGGNFHGEALALSMDYLAMGLAELCNICERRIEKMMNPTFSQLPHFLIDDAGLNSGLMIAHVTAAALASENKYLCHPASVDSIPTSTDKEDHVSMGVTSGRKLREVIDNLKTCLSIELLCNTQALDLLSPLKTTNTLEKIKKLIRVHVPFIEKDRVFNKDIQNIKDLIERNEILKIVEEDMGPLK